MGRAEPEAAAGGGRSDGAPDGNGRARPDGSAGHAPADAAAATFEADRRRVDAALEALLDRELGDGGAAAAPVRHAVLGPGKRVRPLLLLAAHEAAGGRRRPPVFELACSVELVHAYSLVHDDLPCMDDDVLRRGRPTLHVRYGVPAAVFAGAALMPLAARAVVGAGTALGLGADRVRRLLGILTAASGGAGMVGGQFLDLEAEGRPVNRAELEEIHRGKTAALMAAAVHMGAVAAEADPALAKRLERFGRRLGLAFQAVDDILDVTGDVRELGKAGGRDEELDKATYPSVLGLEGARRVSRRLADAARSELDGLDGTERLARLVDFVVERSR